MKSKFRAKSSLRLHFIVALSQKIELEETGELEKFYEKKHISKMDWKPWLTLRLKWQFCPQIALFLSLILQNALGQDISKRERQIITIIEDHALNLESRKFYFDPIMVQAQSDSVYSDPKKKEGQDMIFRKENSDNGKEAIALSSEDNHWAIPTPRGGKKRQFILLRRAPNGVSVGTPGSEKTPYFGSFVYVTNLLPNSSDQAKTFEVAGSPAIVEWDVWETRPAKNAFYAGWDTCDYTLLFTCESLQDMMVTASEEVDEDTKEGRRRKREAPIARRKLWRKRRDAEVKDEDSSVSKLYSMTGVMTPIKTEEGFDPDEYNDLFLDLDIHIFTPEPKKEKKSHIHLGTGRFKAQAKRAKRFFRASGKAAASADASVTGTAKKRFDKGTNFFKSVQNSLTGEGKAKGGLTGMLSGLVGAAGSVIGGAVDATVGAGLDIAAQVPGGDVLAGLAEASGDVLAGLGSAGAGILGSLAGEGGVTDPLALFGSLGVDGVLGGMTDLSLSAGGEGKAGPLGLLSGLAETALGTVAGGLSLGGGAGGNPFGALTGLLGGLTGSLGIEGMLEVGGEGGPLGIFANLLGGLSGGLEIGGEGGPLGALAGLMGGLTGGLDLGAGAEGGGPLGIFANLLGGLSGGLDIGGEGGLGALTGLLGGLTGALGGGLDLGIGGEGGGPLGVFANLLGGLSGGLDVGGEGGPLGALTGLLGGLSGGLDIGGEGGPLGALTGLLGGLSGGLNIGGEGGPLGALTGGLSGGLGITGEGGPLSMLTGLLGGLSGSAGAEGGAGVNPLAMVTGLMGGLTGGLSAEGGGPLGAVTGIFGGLLGGIGGSAEGENPLSMVLNLGGLLGVGAEGGIGGSPLSAILSLGGGEAGPLGSLTGLLQGALSVGAELNPIAMVQGLLGGEGSPLTAFLSFGGELNPMAALSGMLCDDGNPLSAALNIGGDLNPFSLLTGMLSIEGNPLSIALNVGAEVGAEATAEAEAGLTGNLEAAATAGAEADASAAAHLQADAAAAFKAMGGSKEKNGAMIALSGPLAILSNLKNSLGAEPLKLLVKTCGPEAFASLTTHLGADGIAQVTGMIGPEGLATLSTSLGTEGLGTLKGLLGKGLPLAALTGIFSAENPLEALTGIAAKVQAEGSFAVGGEAAAGARRRRRRSLFGAKAGGSAGLGGLGKLVGGGKGGGFMGGLSTGVLGSDGNIIDGTIATAIGSSLDTIVGKGLDDVGFSSISGAISGISEGNVGQLALMGNLLQGGLGSGGAIDALLKGDMFDVVNTQVNSMSSGLAGNVLNFFSSPSSEGVSGAVGGVISNILKGNPDAGPGGSLKMAANILGPISSSMDPINAITSSAMSISQSLPVLGKGMGQNILSMMPNVVESMGLGGLAQTMGIGPIIGQVNGLGDSIITSGESLFSPMDVVGNGVIEGITNTLVDMGVPPEFARLAATGSKLAYGAEIMKYKGGALGVRLYSDLIGAQLNGGNYRGAGAGPAVTDSMKNWQSMFNVEGEPSNAHVIHGHTYPGAGGDKDFFFPESAYVRSIFKPDDKEGTLHGYHFAAAEPGVFDLFFADDPAQIEEFVDTYGTLTPEQYKQPHRDANNGVKGKMEKDGKFVPNSKPKDAVVCLDNAHTYELYWIPPDTKRKAEKRPAKDTHHKTMIYGHLFNGIRQSPHIFVAEGDTLTGFFVPDDPNYPHIKDTPHGIFVPDSVAGHGRFVLEDKSEYDDVKEVRGAFFPDSMNLAGAFGGRLSKSRNDVGVFNFVMDRLAVEFVYVKGHEAMKNVWAAFLNKEEWSYTPPPIPPPADDIEGNPAAEEGEDDAAKGGLVSLNLNVGGKGKRDYYGIKIQSQRTEAFLPADFEIEGAFVPVDKTTKRPPMGGSLKIGKINTQWTLAVTKKAEDAPVIDKPLPCLFVPVGYPKDDALIGLLQMEADNNAGTIQFIPKQKQSEHFYEKGDEIWVPPKFANSAFVEEDKGDDEDVIPGVITKARPPPERIENYFFGPDHDSTSKDFTDDSLKDLPHIYQFGYYFHDPSSTGPLFIPQIGAAGIFTPDDAAVGPQEAALFPASLSEEGATSKLVLKEPGSIPAGTAGQFKTHLKGPGGDNVQSEQSFKATAEDGTLKVAEGVEIIPGWELADTVIPENGVHGEFEPVEATRKQAMYRLVNVGGGFKGVVISGPKDLDDPNNPVFQRYLHYRAQRDGDVNPWGNVVVVDPIDREPAATPEGLGLAHVKPVQASAPKITKTLLERFSLRNWEWPLAREKHPKKLALGEVVNIVNMMDYRMWLLTKYDCKYVKNEDGTTIKMLTPKSGDGYLDDLTPAVPKADWLKHLSDSKVQLYQPDTEGVMSHFAKMFNINQEEMGLFAGISSKALELIHQAQAKGGAEPAPPKPTPFDEWGDTHQCEQVEVDDLTMAQATEEQPMNGVDLGLQLTENVGSTMDYPQLASKLLKQVKKKQEAPPGSALDNLGSTDLLGGVRGKFKAIVKERKEAKTESGEVTAEASAKRKKRDADPKMERKTAKNIPGWKTQFRAPLDDNKTISSPGVIFYGLGNCEQKETPPLELYQSKNPLQMIKYFMLVLRIDCMHQAKEQITELVNENYIQLSDSQEYFEVSTSNPIINEQRLFPEEIRMLSAAFEFSAFTEIYHTLRTSGSPSEGHIEQPNCITSRSVGFLTEMTLYYIMHARRVSPSHSVRLTRNLLKTLRTVMTKLNQDCIALRAQCPDKCEFDKKLTNGDKFRVMSLIQFIIHGMGPYNKGEELKPSFYTFVGNNKVAIKERVKEFEKQYATKH